MTSFRFYGLTLAVALLLAMGESGAEKKRYRLGPAAGLEPVTLPDLEVTTSSGAVSFHNVVISPDRKEHRLRVNGIVTNLTDRRWRGILFNLELLGLQGERIGDAELMYSNLERDQSRKMSKSPEGEVIQLLDGKQPEFTGYRIVYRVGELDIKYILTLLKPQPNRLLQYADQDVSFSFSLSDACIDFKLRNISRSPVTLDWSEARFVDIFEQSHEVSLVGTGDPKVPPDATLADSIEPIVNTPLAPNQYEGWRAGRVLPRTQDAGELKGRTVSLSIPVEFNGVKRIYLFIFQIAEILL